MRRLKIQDAKLKERMVWQEILRSADSRYDHRLHGVLAVCRGLSCYEAAAVWGRSPRSVENWVRRFSDGGIEGLRERIRPGRPARLTSDQRRLLSSDLRRGPSAAGFEEERWTGMLLQKHLRESYGAEIGIRQCQRLIRNMERGARGGAR